METLVVLACITLILINMCCIVYLVGAFKHSIEKAVNIVLKELDRE